MAVAPIIGVGISAAGTVAGISQQSSAARQQQEAIANQELIARDNLTIKQNQFEQAKITNEQRYIQEKALLDEQTNQARVNLEIQRANAEMQDLQAQLGIDLASQQAQQQAAQLIQSAEATDTEAAQLNTQQLFQLAQQLEGSDRAAADFLVNAVAATGGQSQVIQNLLLQNNLGAIEQGQDVRESVATRSRVAGFSSDAQRAEADIVRQQGVLTTDYLSSLQDLQRRANDIAFQQAEFDITNVSQQNQAALQAANLAAQAELQSNRGAAELEFRSQQAAFDAQRGAVQQPNTFGAISNLAVSGLSLLSPSSSQPVFGSTSGTTFQSASSPAVNTSNLSFGGQFTTGL
jgi:hypothetical protein